MAMPQKPEKLTNLGYGFTRVILLEAPYAMGLILVGMAPCAPFLPMVVDRAHGAMGYTARSERSVRRIRGCGAIALGWAASNARRSCEGRRSWPIFVIATEMRFGRRVMNHDKS